MRQLTAFCVLVCTLSILTNPLGSSSGILKPPTRRNVIIFVADGLRAGSVNAKDTPALWSVRTEGVFFSNSHSLYPTFTTANASAIATGHGLGDTGDFSNTIWTGYAAFDTGNFGAPIGTPTPFIENDQILADLAGHYRGNYLGETTLLTAAMQNGFNTAAIGKLGPTAIQQLEAIAPSHLRFPTGGTSVIIDDLTGNPGGIPLLPQLIAALADAGLSAEAPTRTNGYGPTAPWNNGYAGTLRQPGTQYANVLQQQWFADVTTRVLLPALAKDAGKPFVLLYWSRDPDGTQHNEGDSAPGTLFPGINGDSSRMGVQNADRNLRQILDWLNANPEVKANTDLFVTSDHGFATISRKEVTRTGHSTASESAKHYYFDANGNLDTDMGTLPQGFLAIDLALGLNTNLFDPDRHAAEGTRGPYRQLKLRPEQFEHPAQGNGLLGDVVETLDGSDAQAIVAANGGSDLIYVPDKNSGRVRRIVNLLETYDYVGGIFVDDQYGAIPGTLPLSVIGLAGSTALPRPAIVVAFKVFYLNPGDLQTAVQVSDTSLQGGQGMHGGFGRDSTLNNMAAIGPDFKTKFDDAAPISNADIAPTIAQLLGIEMRSNGALKGRVIAEALLAGPERTNFTANHIESGAGGGHKTVLFFQEIGGVRYFDRACFLEAAAASQCP